MNTPTPIKYPLACGCAGPQYLSMCQAHRAEDRARDARALGVDRPALEAELVDLRWRVDFAATALSVIERQRDALKIRNRVLEKRIEDLENLSKKDTPHEA